MKKVSVQSKNCVIYARVSSKEQEKEGFSIPSQLKSLNGYADKEGFNIIQEYIDVETAKRSGRTYFNEMVSFLKKNSSTRIILVEKTDRLYRNLKDWVILEELGLEIHLVKENAILSETSRSSEKFMHGIKVLMAKNYIDNLSEETKKGMLEKAEQGIWPSFAPMGYKNIQTENGRKIIVVDDKIAPLIKKIYELYATGNYSVIEVTRKVKELGLSFWNGKAHLPQSTIHKILRNRVYTGDFEWNGKIYKGTHEAMVDYQLWTHVQDLIENKLGNRQKKVKHNFAFAGFIRCSLCGCSLVGDIKKQKYIYYRCTGCKKEHAKPYVKESIIEEKFAQILQTLHFDQDILNMIIHALKESNEDKHKYYEAAVLNLQTQFNKLSSRLQAMYVDKLDGNITNEFFEDKSREWKNEQSNILKQIDQHKNANHSYIDEGIALLELAQNAHSLFIRQDAAEKRRLLNFVTSNSIWDGENLIPTFKQPFDMIASSKMEIESRITPDMSKSEIFANWLPGPDSNQRPSD